MEHSLLWLDVLGALLVIGFGLAFRGHKAKVHPEEHIEGEKQPNVLAAALRLRIVWIAAFFLLFYVGIEVSLASWSFSFLTEERHQTLALAGLAVSGQWLGLTVGRLVLGKVGERIGNRLLISFCLVGVVGGVLVVWLIPVGWVMLVGFWIIGFALAPIFPTTIAMMSGLVAGAGPAGRYRLHGQLRLDGSRPDAGCHRRPLRAPGALGADALGDHPGVAPAWPVVRAAEAAALTQ